MSYSALHPHDVSADAPRSSTPATMLPAVPAALLLDKRLMPLERNAWMVLYASADEAGRAVGISYTQLRHFLACVPDIELASRETVARTITVLRLTRWIHTEARARNPLTGFLPTNHYAVHVQPLSIGDVCQRDLTWPDLLEQAFNHASLAVRQIAQHVLLELVAEPALLARMPASVQARTRTLVPTPQDDGPGSGAAGSDKREPATAEESGSARDAIAAKPNGVRMSYLKESTYVPLEEKKRRQAAPVSALALPARFTSLRLDQQRDALRRLQRLDGSQRQSVLDEWAARCGLGQVLKPAAYLFGLIQRALSGEFTLWAGRKPDRPAATVQATATSAAASVPPPTPVSREVAQQHLAQLRALVQWSGRPAVRVSGLRPILRPA